MRVRRETVREIEGGRERERSIATSGEHPALGYSTQNLFCNYVRAQISQSISRSNI